MTTFHLNQTEILKLLGNVQSITDKKTTIETLQNVLIEKNEKDSFLTLKATDLQLSYLAKIPCKDPVSFQFLVSSRSFYEILKEFPSDCPITFKIREQKWIYLNFETIDFKLRIFDTDKFPLFPEMPVANATPIEAAEFRKMVDATIFASSPDDSRVNMMNIFFGKKNTAEGKSLLFMVGTDGFRLSRYQINVPADNTLDVDHGVIIPKKGLIELKKMIELGEETLDVILDAKNLIFVAGNQKLLVRLLEGGFVDYNRLIPENTANVAVIDRNKLFYAIKRVSVLSMMSLSKSRSIRFELDSDGLTILSELQDVGDGTERIPVQYEGEKVNFSLNGKYFLDCLGLMRAEKVSIGFNNEKSPILVLEDQNPDWDNIIMPITVDNR